MSINAIAFPRVARTTSILRQQQYQQPSPPSLLYPSSSFEIEKENRINQDHTHLSNPTTTISSPSRTATSPYHTMDPSSSSYTKQSSYQQQQQQQNNQYQPEPIYVNIETIRMQLSVMIQRLQSRVSIDTIRSIPIFLGMNTTMNNNTTSSSMCLSGTAYTPPVRKLLDKSTPEKIYKRLQINISYFISNYVVIVSMTSLIIALMHPGMILFVTILIGLWRIHKFLCYHPLIIFQNIEVHNLLSQTQRFYILFSMTCFVIVWKCLLPTIYMICISSCIILFHALLRDPKDVEAYATTTTSLHHQNGHSNDSDDDVDIEGGGNSYHHSNTTNDSILTERLIMKSSPVEKRRNITTTTTTTVDGISKI